MLCSFSSQAQTGNLTIFGEQIPFHLYINDIQQNEKPETHIRINGIPSNYINLKIVFTDPSLPAINRKDIGLIDADNIILDVIYRLKKEKDGKIKFQFFGNAPAGKTKPDSVTIAYPFKQTSELNRVIPKLEQLKKTDSLQIKPTEAVKKEIKSVVQKTEPVKKTDSAKIKSTEVTKKAIKEEKPIDVKQKEIPVDRKEVKVAEIKTVSKPDTDKTNNVTLVPIKKCTGWPVAKEDFDKAKAAVVVASSPELKLKEAKSLAAVNCLMVTQVSELTQLLQTEDARMNFIKFAYAFTIDRQNYSKLKSYLKDGKNINAVEELIKLR